jgi:hypothetical protein
VQGLFAGSIGVIEECFSAELVADSSDRARRASVITPARIAGLPLEQRQALFSALIAHREQLVAHGEQSVEDYRRALQSEPGGTRPTMLLDRPTLGGYRTLEHGLRVVAYFGRVLVDDPLQPGTLLGDAADKHLHEVLAWLAEVRPSSRAATSRSSHRSSPRGFGRPTRPSPRKAPSGRLKRGVRSRRSPSAS